MDFDRWGELCGLGDHLIRGPIKLTDDDFKALELAQDAIKKVVHSNLSFVPTKDWNEPKLTEAVEGLRGPARTLARFLFAGPDNWRTLTIPVLTTVKDLPSLETEIKAVTSATLPGWPESQDIRVSHLFKLDPDASQSARRRDPSVDRCG